MAESPKETSDPCLAMLRETDRDRYLACLLSPEDKRGALAALYAFNAEIARVRDVVREPLPGEIRLQWWRDLLEGNAQGDSGGNPVAVELLGAIEKYRLPRQTFVDMIEARIFDLYDDPLTDRHALEGYAGETASALIQLASLILSPDDAARSADAAGHAGVAQAIAGFLLLMPIHRRRRQLYLPLDILSATGLDRDTFLDGEDKPRISAAIEAFAGLGLEHLARARKAGAVPASVLPAFLPVALAGPVLRQAVRAGAAVLDTSLQSPQWRRQLRLLKAAVSRRF
ncbi:phytoene/squalene synthase family protein [Neorhizobium petrolearium]|uniref:Phytoene/squalene synthase family protein n=1 Tax=Neorhizobium petrolearium TaxID=515361 RepID=A0ABY8M8E7_9HYPH|nr:phytoene/squalene synthase family protein [Neorhizobium petrolearium]MCC2609828.1 phytoene/squalene synthase family protein [Neorhizobium petrolearium]WGI70016.1 phytoene/squalene synthase family protein [Neorhizobium petrolearium]